MTSSKTFRLLGTFFIRNVLTNICVFFFLSLNWICVHTTIVLDKNKNTNKELTVRWMIESTKKRREVEWLNQHKKNCQIDEKKKKTILLPSNRAFFCLTAHLIVFFFSVEFFGHNCKQLFFSQLLWPYHLFWDKSDSPAQLCVLKKNNSLSHCKRSCRRIRPKKKENNTAALNWVSVEKKKDAYKLVDLPA